MKVGFEKIAVYPGPMKVDLTALARQRGEAEAFVKEELLLIEGSKAPLWEDTVTLAVNSARPLLSEAEKKEIGLFIVGTESGLDQEKTISTWAHEFLGLPSNCRVMEIKVACHAGAAGLRMAESWIRSGNHHGKKCLLITSDMSYSGLGKGKIEYSLGGGAVAMLISEQPDFAEIEFGRTGVHTQNVTDVIRPLPWKEIAFDVEASLFAYMDGLEYAYEDYKEKAGEEVGFDDFDYHLYHVPFPGISREAHKLFCALNGLNKAETERSFQEKVMPALHYPRRIGATYAGSIFLGLFSVINRIATVEAGERIGIYSYGSGSCAEFFSVLIGDKAKTLATEQGALLDETLAARYPLSVEEYEALDQTRTEVVQAENFTPDYTLYGDWFERFYEGRNRLILKAIKGHERIYDFV